MSQHEFIAIDVAVPLMVAIGWLLWRTRRLLRGVVLYALAIAALLAVVRLGHMAWRGWEHSAQAGKTDIAGFCADINRPRMAGQKNSCWM